MIVENTEARVYCIAELKLRKITKAPVPGSPPEPQDALMPGVNEVHEDVWAVAMKNPLVQYLVDKGVLVPHDAKKSVEDITKLKGPEAIEFVKRTLDKALLDRFLKQETRKAVVEVIEKQIEAVTPKVPKEE